MPGALEVPFHAGPASAHQTVPPARGAPPGRPHPRAVVQSRIVPSRSPEFPQLSLPLLYSRSFHFATEARRHPHPDKPPTCSRQKPVPRIEPSRKRLIARQVHSVLIFRRLRQVQGKPASLAALPTAAKAPRMPPRATPAPSSRLVVQRKTPTCRPPKPRP